MTPHKQLYRHHPERGVHGDCWRTAIGCLLDLKPNDVPHFFDEGVEAEPGREACRNWLRKKGFSIISIAFEGELSFIMKSFEAINRDHYFLLSGESKTGTNHSVVCLGKNIVHDPSLDETGIVGPCDDGLYWIEFIVPSSMTKNG